MILMNVIVGILIGVAATLMIQTAIVEHREK